MLLQSTATLIILLASQAYPIKGHGSIDHEELILNVCSNNDTFGISLMTKHFEDGNADCKCKITRTTHSESKDGYVSIPGFGQYKLYLQAMNWNEARKKCNEDNAQLAVIYSAAEEVILMNMLKEARSSIQGALNTEEAFLGIHDIYKEGEWVTIFGENLYSTGYSKWRLDGQPDNLYGHQNCGAITIQGGMDDVFCDLRLAFFCKSAFSCDQSVSSATVN